jgi:lantibiotic modifying enzyme
MVMGTSSNYQAIFRALALQPTRQHENIPWAVVWRPILTSKAHIEAVHRLTLDVRDAIASTTWKRDASVASGEAGVALFHAYAWRTWPDYGGEGARDSISRAIETVASDPTAPAVLFAGFSGVAWTIEHLRPWVEGLDEDSASAVDEALLDHLAEPVVLGNQFDLMTGLAGLCVYAAARHPHSAAAALLERTVEKLERSAELRDGALAWRSTTEILPREQRSRYPLGYFDLGVAHGVPGVIGALVEAYEIGVARWARVELLIEGAVTWLLAQRRPRESPASFGYASFPDGEPGTDEMPTPLAWCYGDAGAMVVLLYAARVLGRHDWEAAALEIAHKAARRTIEDSGVKDGGLCHGAAGLGHFFNRMYQATGELDLREAATKWFERALATDHLEAGAPLDFIYGAAGTALALLGAVGSVEPAWDRLFVASVPPR